MHPGLWQLNVCPTRINGAPGAVPFFCNSSLSRLPQILSHPRLLGCKGGKSLPFLHWPKCLEQPEGSTLGHQTRQPTSARSPRSAGSSLIQCPHPSTPHSLQLCAPEPPRAQHGAPPLPCSAQVRFAEGRGEVAPSAAFTPVLCPIRFGPQSTVSELGTLPLTRTQVSPGCQESPSHTAAMETPEHPVGTVGVGLQTWPRRWKGVEAGARERRGA